MGIFDDPNKDPRDRRAQPAVPDAGAPAGGGGAPMTPQAAPGQAHGTGFVNPQTYLAANQQVGQGMASAVAGETARQGDSERAALQSLQAGQLAPTELEANAQTTGARARLAAPGGGGLSSVMAADYGQQSPYGSGMASFDAFLAGGAGGKTLQTSGNQYGNLSGEVNAYNQQAAAYQPPPAAPASPPAAGGAPASPAGKARRPVPAPMAPTTYNPEQTEMPAAVAAKRQGQQMDPWTRRPWGGR